MKLKSQSCRLTKSGEKVDRLSELPIQLKEAILGCLPITDAIKTSVLSREWRYIWTGVTKLVVNWRFWEPWNWKGRMRKVKAVNKILLAHNGPIREFYLDVTYFDCYLDAGFWLLSLSKKGVENIKITGFYCFNRKYLSIPSSMFECRELKRLSLSHCGLSPSYCGLSPPSEFRGFHNLVSLYLNCVRIESQFLRNLIRQCPLLETLTIGHEPFGLTEIPIVLNSHSVKSLKLINIYLGSVSFENVPNLTNVSLWGMSGYDQRDLQKRLKAWEFMSFLIGIKELSFQFSLLEISDSDVIPKRLPELLGNLKTVDLHYMDASSVDQMAFMFCIISSSPNLQNLNIHMRYMYKCGRRFDKDSLRAVIAYLEVEAKGEIKTSITTVSVYFEKLNNHLGWEHIEAEIALIESIVSCCPALRKLVIKGSSFVKGYAKLQLSRALRRIGRSSGRPKIVYFNAY
ncbi:unnamed protein product [Rhodiola kirilowii]